MREPPSIYPPFLMSPLIRLREWREKRGFPSFHLCFALVFAEGRENFHLRKTPFLVMEIELVFLPPEGV